MSVTFYASISLSLQKNVDKQQTTEQRITIKCYVIYNKRIMFSEVKFSIASSGFSCSLLEYFIIKYVFLGLLT